MPLPSVDNTYTTVPLRGKKSALYRRYLQLEDDRSSWRSHWQEITDYITPRRGRYLIESQNSKVAGSGRAHRKIHSTQI